MKPLAGRYQTATEVKGLSHEIINVKEVDSVHLLEDSKNDFDTARNHSLFRGLRPWYDIEWKLQELGRPNWFSVYGISADNSKRRGSGEDQLGVGLTHSRGVAEVMFCESLTSPEGVSSSMQRR